jgi:hypothetical protein
MRIREVLARVVILLTLLLLVLMTSSSCIDGGHLMKQSNVTQSRVKYLACCGLGRHAILELNSDRNALALVRIIKDKLEPHFLFSILFLCFFSISVIVCIIKSFLSWDLSAQCQSIFPFLSMNMNICCFSNIIGETACRNRSIRSMVERLRFRNEKGGQQHE